MSLLDVFFEECRHQFAFLENHYSLCIEKEDTVNISVIQDAYAILPYVGKKISVVLRWYFIGSLIEVIFLELKEEWRFPVISVNNNNALNEYPNAARAITIYTLATTLGNAGDDTFLLKNVTDTSTRQCKIRAKIIMSRLPEVISGLAVATQKYASDILSGDTQIFTKVMEYQTKIADDSYKT